MWPWEVVRRIKKLEKNMSELQDQIAKLQDDFKADAADLTATKTKLTTLTTDVAGLHQAISDQNQTILTLQAQIQDGQAIDLSDLVASSAALRAQADDVLQSASAVDPALPPSV